MKRLRVGLLGCGGIAQMHLRSLSMMDDVQLVGACDLRPEAAQDVAARFTCSAYTDFEKMLKDQAMEAVLITLPPFAHNGEIELAAGKGLHIFMEKPIALDMDKALQLVKTIERSGVISQVDFQYRFAKPIVELKRQIDAGTAGRVSLLIGHYACNDLHTPWWRQRKLSGGQLVEQAIHLVDCVKYLMGEAKSVYGVQKNLGHTEVENYSSEDTSVTTIEFANGAMATVGVSNNAIPFRWDAEFRLIADNMVADVELFSGREEAIKRGTGGRFCQGTFYQTGKIGAVEVVSSNANNLHYLCLRDFVTAVQNGRQSSIPVNEGAKSLAITLAAGQSASMGQRVAPTAVTE